MPASTDPNLGLSYGWTLGESAWNTGMDGNLKKLGALVYLTVKSRSVATPPGSPVNGDRYIIPSGATGAWSGRTNQIAVFLAAWEYYVPAAGFAAWVEDEALSVTYRSGAWTQGPATNQDIAYAATITPDASLGERVIVGVLTGNITINAPTNPRKGAKLEFAFEQDGTGGRTITWNAVFKKAADGAGTANQKTASGYIYDGTHWVQLSGAGIVWL